MYRRIIPAIAIMLTLARAGTTYAAAGAQTADKSQSSGQASQGGQVSTCSWPSSPSSDPGGCNTCAAACQGGQSAVCTPGVVQGGMCVKQPDCTCH